MDALEEIRKEDEELRRIRNRFLQGTVYSSDEMFLAVEELIAFRIKQSLRRKGL